MPLQRTEVLVLRRTQVRDSSLFLVCLSPDQGKITLTARAARRPGSGTAEALEYFTVSEVNYYQRENRHTDYIANAVAKERFRHIADDETRYGHACAALEFLNLFLPDAEANRGAYYLLKRYLRLLDKSGDENLIRELLHFWLLLCILTGYAPQLEACSGCGANIEENRPVFSPELGGLVCKNCVKPDQLTQQVDRGTIMVVDSLADTDIDARRKVELSGRQSRQLRDLLVAITEYHVGRRAQLKSFDFLRKLDLFRLDGGTSG
jgi:DNA repair protein RecO (recombination protein O)